MFRQPDPGISGFHGGTAEPRAGELGSGGERGAGAGADRGRDIKRLARGADYAFDARMSRSRIFPWRYGMFLALLASMAPLGLLLPWHEAVMAGFDVAALAFILSARSEEHTSELQSLMRLSFAVFFLK